jgi:hypothetical protein
MEEAAPMNVVPEPSELAERPQWTPVPVTAIASHDEYATVGRYLTSVKAFQKRVIDFFAPHKARALAAHRALCDDEKKALAPALADEAACKSALVAFDTAQEQIRVAEERRLQEIARQDAETRRLNEAAALEREGNATNDPELLYEAHQLMEQPVETATVILERSTPKVSGLSYREQWRFRIVNPSLVPREYLVIDNVKIGGVVRALKGETKIPGVQVYSEKVAAASGR